MLKNTIAIFSTLIMFLCISFTTAQHTYELKFTDCEKNSDVYFPKTTFKITGTYEVLKNEYTSLVFKTSESQIKVSYTNLYDQEMDNVFILPKEGSISPLYLCLDNFKDTIQETCIENSLKTNTPWKLTTTTVGCHGRSRSKIIITSRKGIFMAKYVFSKYIPEKKKYKKVVKRKILNEAQLNNVILFEKKLRLHGSSVQKKYGDSITGIYLYTYKIQSGNIEKVVKSSLMLQTINERFLLQKLGFTD